MRPKELPTIGDVKGAQALHAAVLVTLNYFQLLAKASPRSYAVKAPRVILMLETAVSCLQAWAPKE